MGWQTARVRATPWGTYARIADALRARLSTPKPGAPVPSEAALAAEFGVARNTVRRALAALEHDGVIVSLPGRGRVVGGTGAAAGYRRVADALRAEITSGRWVAGDRVPSESELMSLYGVSRSTVRRGLSVMEAEGLVTAVHGQGTFRARFRTRLISGGVPAALRSPGDRRGRAGAVSVPAGSRAAAALGAFPGRCAAGSRDQARAG